MHVMVTEIELLVAGLDFIEELGNGDHVPLRIVACAAGEDEIPFGIALDERPRDDVIEFSFPVFEGLTAAKNPASIRNRALFFALAYSTISK